MQGQFRRSTGLLCAIALEWGFSRVLSLHTLAWVTDLQPDFLKDSPKHSFPFSDGKLESQVLKSFSQEQSTFHTAAWLWRFAGR
jgi:hypothetical protein